MKNHYVIGDIHGEYATLLDLLEKLPQDANIVFVGDFVDRGLQSREVIELVRSNNYAAVRGNHEDIMGVNGIAFVQYLLGEKDIFDLNEHYLRKGFLNTYASYGLVTFSDDDTYEFNKENIEGIEQFLDDLLWMRELPTYLELDAKHSSGKQVVVSHSNISKAWQLRDDKEKRKEFIDIALWTRETETVEGANIFNIYGHMAQKYGAVIKEDYVCIDSGCCFASDNDEFYGRLSAYCVETGEVVESRKVWGRV